MKTLVSFAFAAALVAAPAASAETAQDFQLYVLGNLNLHGNNVNGRAAVGGNATFTGTSISGASASSPSSLVVGGNLAYNNGGSIAGGALVGGTSSAPGYMPVSSGIATLPVNFASENQRLSGLSASLAGRTANGVSELKWGGLFLKGSDASLNVFNIDGSTLSQASWLNADIAAGSQVLINVSGGTANLTGGLSFFPSSNVLWNFSEATTVQAANVSLGGSVLAPNATFMGGGGTVGGKLIVGNFDGAMSFGGAGYSGSLLAPSPVSNVPNPAPAPLAAGGPLLLAGGALLWRRRRSLRAAAAM